MLKDLISKSELAKGALFLVENHYYWRYVFLIPIYKQEEKVY